MRTKLFPPYTRRYAVASLFTRGYRLVRRQGLRAFLAQLLRPGDWWALAKSPVVLDDLDANYQAWLASRPPVDAGRLQAEAMQWSHQPLISIVMPVFNPIEADFRAALASIRSQTYPRWQACLADDASTAPHVRDILRSLDGDERFVVTYRAEQGGISAASNSALATACGEFVALMDHDDLLAPEALHEVVRVINDHPEVDFIYSDEDKVDPEGRRVEPVVKPDWSPALLLSMNYITHLSVMRRDLVSEVGGFRTEFDGSQDYDLILRVTEKARAIAHVRKVLYSWRITRTSTAGSATAKPWAWTAGSRALEDALRRRGIAGAVEKGIAPGRYRTRFYVPGDPLVSVIIPTRDRLPLLERCLASVERSSYARREVVIVDNGSVEPATLAFLERTPYRVVRSPGPFNFSTLVNRGAEAASGDHLLLLNNDTEAQNRDWIEALLELSAQRDVGAVGARLLYPNGRVQHEGVVLGAAGVFACHLDWRGYLNLGDVIRDVGAVTAACMMTRRTAWDMLGGFDERFAIGYGDVDYCLRVRERGHRVVYTPYARLVHVEGASRGRGHPAVDDRMARERWGEIAGLDDPHYNRMLDLILGPFATNTER